jgi:site-specific recombinase XerD
MATLAITETAELRRADHRAVIAWERHMRETERAAPPTIRRRLSALSSLFRHLVRHGFPAKNPVTEIDRPAINREEGTMLAFAKQDARKLLDLPDPETVEGPRDRAILSVGLQVGLRRAEIAALKVGDPHQNRGYDSLRVTRKGGRRDALAINPRTAARLRAYLAAAGREGGEFLCNVLNWFYPRSINPDTRRSAEILLEEVEKIAIRRLRVGKSPRPRRHRQKWPKPI